MKNATIAAVLVIAALGAAAVGDVKLPDLISDGMVLQRGIQAPVWGLAAPGEQVTVTVAGQSATAKAAPDGKWIVRLPPLEAGGPHVMTIAGRNTLTLENVMVGEVWLCSGGGNMVWEVQRSANAEQEIPSAYFPNIRLFTVTKKTIHEPTEELRGWWLPCNRKTVARFSGVGYFFGRRLHQDLNVPIGLIQSAVGGTPIELWTPRDVLLADPEAKAALATYEDSVKVFQAQVVKVYQQSLADWQAAAQQARAEGRPEPRKPNPPKPARLGGCYYNGMIYPVAPYGLAGVIWYQGESNVQCPQIYARLFPAMIAAWRARWGQGDFPFLFVQLANYMAPQTAPSDSNLARFREAQLQSLSVPKTGMAIAIDLGDPNEMRPANKQDVGNRLALVALKVAYGRDGVYFGPTFQAMEVKGNKATLTFQNVGAGLVAKGDKLTGFAVAGDDRIFVWADAAIRGDKVVVSSPAVPAPIAIRYAWADNPDGSLYNQEGLPACPFRTDDWPPQQPIPVTPPPVEPE